MGKVLVDEETLRNAIMWLRIAENGFPELRELRKECERVTRRKMNNEIKHQLFEIMSDKKLPFEKRQYAKRLYEELKMYID